MWDVGRSGSVSAMGVHAAGHASCADLRVLHGLLVACSREFA